MNANEWRYWEMSWYNIFFDNKLVVVETQIIMTSGFLTQGTNDILASTYANTRRRERLSKYPKTISERNFYEQKREETFGEVKCVAVPLAGNFHQYLWRFPSQVS